MIVCPEHRTRLFLTVDLAGSTAFKANAASTDGKAHSAWVYGFRDFYRVFPEVLDFHYRETKSGKPDDEWVKHGPKLWKLIGDELLFCCKVLSLEHLSCCVTAFIGALEQYGASLSPSQLDVKGAGWVAEFPAKNVSFFIADGNIAFTFPNEDFVTEAFETNADAEPHNFDFLGSSIDAGFRVARHADTDRFAASAELALLLAEAKEHKLFTREFRYDGRQHLKGVNGDQPYPIVCIDTERDARKREVRTRERLVTRESDIAPLALYDFLKAYLLSNGTDVPVLPLNSRCVALDAPASYEAYKARWLREVEDAKKQDENLEESASPEANGDASALDSLITSFAEQKQNAWETFTRRRSSRFDEFVDRVYRDADRPKTASQKIEAALTRKRSRSRRPSKNKQEGED